MEATRKYNRKITGLDGVNATVDVYRVLVAFQVTDPEIQHAIKKLLCGGLRAKGSREQDYREAMLSIEKWHQRMQDEASGDRAWTEAKDPGADLDAGIMKMQEMDTASAWYLGFMLRGCEPKEGLVLDVTTTLYTMELINHLKQVKWIRNFGNQPDFWCLTEAGADAIQRFRKANPVGIVKVQANPW